MSKHCYVQWLLFHRESRVKGYLDQGITQGTNMSPVVLVYVCVIAAVDHNLLLPNANFEKNYTLDTSWNDGDYNSNEFTNLRVTPTKCPPGTEKDIKCE